MFASILSWFLVITPLLAAPSPTPRSACQPVIQNGNLSPNGVSGNFRLVNGMLAFDPTNLATGFDINMQTCSSSIKVAGASVTGQLTVAATGQCLAAQNATAKQGPTVTGVDCATTTDQLSATWAMYDGFLYSAGLGSAGCASGLWGYQAVSSSGNPAAIQKAPVNLACSADSSVFGFSVLM